MPGCVASASEKHVRSARSPELEGKIGCRGHPPAAGKTRTPPACYNSRYSSGLHRGVLASMKRTAAPGWRNGRRWGLKIPCPEEDVWVRLPPRALRTRNQAPPSQVDPRTCEPAQTAMLAAKSRPDRDCRCWKVSQAERTDLRSLQESSRKRLGVRMTPAGR